MEAALNSLVAAAGRGGTAAAMRSLCSYCSTRCCAGCRSVGRTSDWAATHVGARLLNSAHKPARRCKMQCHKPMLLLNVGTNHQPVHVGAVQAACSNCS
jgi:hypothetical protein